MTLEFCTYFNKNYLLKGVSLYHSLEKHCPDFRLWILCFDDESFEIIKKLNLKNAVPIKLSDFEDEKLLAAKKTRSAVEYFWTCTPSLPLYIFNKNTEIEMIAYLDADMYFYDSPMDIYSEFGNNSIMIIPHRFTEENKAQEKLSGIYNVGMLIFRRDKNGIECLNWWRERCLEWCYATYENGKLGDQMYLNDWPERFEKVCVLKNHGADVASWNVKRYEFFKKNQTVWGKEINSGEEFKLIFYHFHGIKIYHFAGAIRLASNAIQATLRKNVFDEYTIDLKQTLDEVRKNEINFYCGINNNSEIFLRGSKKMIIFSKKVLFDFLNKITKRCAIR